MMQKIDYRKELKYLYSGTKSKPVIINVPAMNFLMIDGSGKPDQAVFQQAASSLFPVAYTLKFMIRAKQNLDFHVMPMEVRWRVNKVKKEFKWTMMIMQPEPVSKDDFNEALKSVTLKKNPPLISELRFESCEEGECVQCMYVGEYSGMDAELEKMVEFARNQRYEILSRSTHDIYLNDSRKTRPENLRTIMRLPVQPISH